MKIIVIHNAKSGSALSTKELTKKFKKHSITVERFMTLSPTIKTELQPYIHKSAVIAAIGGDGTISAVAGILHSTDATLIPLPGGTLNHFTKDLGIAQDIDEAIANIRSANTRLIDVATVNDTVFVNNSSIGLYPSSLQERKHFEDRLGKWPAATIGLLRAFIRYRSYEVILDGHTFHTPFLFVGNNNYHLEDIRRLRTHLNQGTLSVYMIVSRSRWTLLKLLPYAFIGKLKEHGSFHSKLTESLIIHTRHKTLRVSHDGEYSRLTSPLRYKILKKSLRVIGSS